MGVPYWKIRYLETDECEDDDYEYPDEKEVCILSEEQIISHKDEELEGLIRKIEKKKKLKKIQSKQIIEEVDLTISDDEEFESVKEEIEEVEEIEDDSVEVVYEENGFTEEDEAVYRLVEERLRTHSMRTRAKPMRKASFFVNYMEPEEDDHFLFRTQKPLKVIKNCKNRRGCPPSSSNQKKFKCPMCEVYFTRKNNIKSHIRIHTGEKPYTCAECGKSFTRKDTFNRHSCKGIL